MSLTSYRAAPPRVKGAKRQEPTSHAGDIDLSRGNLKSQPSIWAAFFHSFGRDLEMAEVPGFSDGIGTAGVWHTTLMR